MANSLLTISMITREAVRLWKNTNAFIQNINRQYDDSYAVEGAKIGASLKIRLPNDYVVRIGPALSVQDTAEQSTTLTLATQAGVDVSFTTVDQTLSLDDYSERVLAPMINNLAGSVAANVMAGADAGGVCNFAANQNVTTLASLAPNSGTVLTAGAILDENSGVTYDRNIVLAPRTMAKAVQSLTGLLNPKDDISKQYRSARVYDALNFDWFQDQTVINHVTGSFTAGTVSGASQTGTTLVTSAITGTLNAGDIITIALVNGVNRITKCTTGTLRQFVVTANVASGATSIPIYPAIIPGSATYVPSTGAGAVQYQTVTVSPANSATILLVNAAGETYRKNIAYTPDAITMVTADLYRPTRGVVDSAREVYDNVSMRMIADYVIGTDQMVTRLDVLYGYLYVRPEWCCVVADSVP
jgi:hypothetical protein